MAEQNSTDLIYSLRRTLVPIVVGALLAQAAKHGIDLDEGNLTAIVTGLYYAIFRVAEAYVPSLGVFLGGTRQPRYDP